jgi:hypothetical protein
VYLYPCPGNLGFCQIISFCILLFNSCGCCNLCYKKHWSEDVATVRGVLYYTKCFQAILTQGSHVFPKLYRVGEVRTLHFQGVTTSSSISRSFPLLLRSEEMMQDLVYELWTFVDRCSPSDWHCLLMYIYVGFNIL